MGLPEKQYITPEQYLESERLALEKHEFYLGEIFAMSGASFRHNQIFKNTYGNLFNKLKGKPCQPYGHGIYKDVLSQAINISIQCEFLAFVIIVSTFTQYLYNHRWIGNRVFYRISHLRFTTYYRYIRIGV